MFDIKISHIIRGRLGSKGMASALKSGHPDCLGNRPVRRGRRTALRICRGGQTLPIDNKGAVMRFKAACTDGETALAVVHTLTKEIKQNPFEGMGKPEPLKHALSGYRSRRIIDEHRIVDRTSEGAIQIAQLGYLY